MFSVYRLLCNLILESSRRLFCFDSSAKSGRTDHWHCQNGQIVRVTATKICWREIAARKGLFSKLPRETKPEYLRPFIIQGPRSKFSSEGAKEECVNDIFFWRGACLWISIQFLLSDGECYYNDKTIDFFPHLQWCCYRVWKFTITKLKCNRLLCYTTDINL